MKVSIFPLIHNPQFPEPSKQRPGKAKSFQSCFSIPCISKSQLSVWWWYHKRKAKGWTVWWGTVKVGLCTASQNRTQTEADFSKHPMPHQHPWRRLWDVWRGTYFPWPTCYHGGRQHATASTIKSTIWLWLPSSEMFIIITVSLLAGPRGPRTPCQTLAIAHCHHSRAGFQLPTALPFLAMGPTKLRPLVGPRPMSALTHRHPIPREVPGDQGWGCPQTTGPHGDSPAPSPQEQPPVQCPVMYFLHCVFNCL